MCCGWLLSHVRLCNPTDCSPLGSSVHGDSPGENTGVGCHFLLQGISWPRGQTQVSHIARGFLTIWATREAQEYYPFSRVSSQHRNWIRSPALQADYLPVELQSLILCQTSKYVKFHQWSMFHFNTFIPKVPEDTKNIEIFPPISTLLSYTSFHLLRFWFSIWTIIKSHNVL